MHGQTTSGIIMFTKRSFLLLCLSFLLSLHPSRSQDISKHQIEAGSKSYDYYQMKPITPVKGILILLPAAGEKAKSIFRKTNLPYMMAKNGITTLTLDVPAQMFADDVCIGQLDELIKKTSLEYGLTYHDVIIGGLSDGGAVALSYAERLYNRPNPIKLKAVFAIDPPIDLERIYQSAAKETGYNCPLIAREGRSVKAYLEKTLGGPPANNSKYEQFAVYSTNVKDGGNAKFLTNIPVRLYCEPDLEYVQKAYCPELQFSNLNAFDLEKLITFLKQAGNQRAQYITTKGKGFHTWNIPDADDLAKRLTNL